MPMAPADIAEFGKLLKKARQKPLPFGLCLGKKPENNVICLDLKKSPEVMMRKAKAEGETGKVTFGTCSVSGKIMTLMLGGKMLPGLAKNMKTFMIKSGMQMKVVIADSSGAVLESDGDEEEEAQLTSADTGHQPQPSTDEKGVEAGPAPVEPDKKGEADPIAEQWNKIAGALAPLAEKFAASADIRANKIKAAWKGAAEAAAKGDFKSAMGVAGKLKPVLTAGPSEAGKKEDKADPDAEKWAKLQAGLEPIFLKALGNNPPERTKMQAAWAMAQESAEQSAFAKGIAILTKLKPLLDKAAAATKTGQEAEVPADVVPFQKSRVLWSKTRQKMFADMTKLEKAIADACAGDDALQPVADSVDNLSKRLSGFDEALETVLDQITNSPDGAAREKLKGAAVKKVQEYQTLLSDPFFTDVDDNNGFVSVKVAATAKASLASIAKTLAA